MRIRSIPKPLFFTFLALTIILSVCAGITSVRAQDDYYISNINQAWARSDNPANNYHEDMPYYVSTNHVMYPYQGVVAVQYDATEFSGLTWEHAYLVFYNMGGAFYGGSSSSTTIKWSVDDTWTTNSLVYNNLPSMEVGITDLHLVQPYTTQELDITSFLDDAVGNATTTVSLYLYNYESNAYYDVGVSNPHDGWDIYIWLEGASEGSPSPSPTANPNNQDDTIYLFTLLSSVGIPLVVVLGCAFICWYMAGAWGFFAGLNLGVIIVFVVLGASYMPLWAVVVIIVVDAMLLFGKIGFNKGGGI